MSTRRRPWTDADVQIVRDLYPDTATEVIAKRLGRPLTSVYRKANHLGMKKSPEYLASPLARRLTKDSTTGVEFRFRAGMTPWNKGSSYVAGGRSAETRFTAGHTPRTLVPIGTERVRDGYLWRKVRDDLVPVRRNWREVHRIVWEEANGPVPPGHAVVFRNRDRSDIRLDNLELITRSELGRRNAMHRLPAEVRKVIHTKAALTRQINKLVEARK